MIDGPTLTVVQPSTRETAPSTAKIVAFWAGLPPLEMLCTFPNLKALADGWGEPFCFRCGWVPPVRDNSLYSGELERVWDYTWGGAGRWLERAHLQDHQFGGGVKPSNLVPLCLLCHQDQPPCSTREAGIAYVNDDPDRRLQWILQFITDHQYQDRRPNDRGQAIRWMLRSYARAGEIYSENASPVRAAA